jgi:hypothetical protein
MSFKLGHVSIPKRPMFSPLFLCCAYDSSVLQNFKIFTHLLPNVSHRTLWWRKWRTTAFRMHYFNDRVRKVPNIYYFGAIFWNHDQEKKNLPVHRYSFMVKYLIKFVVIINRRWGKLIYLWIGSFFFSWSWFQNIAPK